jgi:hypothetical protein
MVLMLVTADVSAKGTAYCMSQTCPEWPHPLSDAYDMAKLLCDKYYMASPELEIQEVNGEEVRLCVCLSVCHRQGWGEQIGWRSRRGLPSIEREAEYYTFLLTHLITTYYILAKCVL